MIFGDEGTQCIAKSQHTSQLTHLNLQTNDIGDEGMKFISESPFLSNLTELHLNLNFCGIKDEGVMEIAESPHMCRLVRLAVGSNCVTVRGVRAIAGSANMARLEVLHVEGKWWRW